MLNNVQINIKKKEDIMSLTTYLKPENQNFYINYLNCNSQIENNDPISDSSDEEY